jgi:hypothetical protein
MTAKEIFFEKIGTVEPKGVEVVISTSLPMVMSSSWV